jgi:arylsulfatase
MLEPKIVPPEGTGLNKDEVTLAELLKKVGHNTAHIGKWHQGDIAQAAPHNQGFDTASYPLHNQATFNFMTIESDEDRLADNVAPRETIPNYRMDKNFRPAGWVLGVDAVVGKDAHEWGVEAGKPLDYAYYDGDAECKGVLMPRYDSEFATSSRPNGPHSFRCDTCTWARLTS